MSSPLFYLRAYFLADFSEGTAVGGRRRNARSCRLFDNAGWRSGPKTTPPLNPYIHCYPNHPNHPNIFRLRDWNQIFSETNGILKLKKIWTSSSSPTSIRRRKFPSTDPLGLIATVLHAEFEEQHWNAEVMLVVDGNGLEPKPALPPGRYSVGRGS